MIVSAIVASALNGVIGKDNQLPWYLPADLKYFKRVTLNHHVIMGRKSFEAIGKPLPKRTNIVITRDLFFIATGCLVVHSLEEALEAALDHGEEEVFIIGGGEIFRQAMPYLDRIYLTEVDAVVEGDVYFPEIHPVEWKEVSRESHPADDQHEYGYAFRVLEKNE